MKDDFQFNISFIREIEKHPSLYNFNTSGYNNRAFVDQVWQDIGDKFKEPVEECKNKWKSIRSSFTRCQNKKGKIKRAAGEPRKKYYLSDYLKFLRPYTKARKHNSSSADHMKEESEGAEDVITEVDVAAYIDEETSDAMNGDSEPEERLLTSATKNIQHKKRKCDDVDQSASEYFALKKIKLMSETQKEPNELFLLSLLPHLKSMNDDQRLQFQIKVLNFIQEMKCSPAYSANLIPGSFASSLQSPTTPPHLRMSDYN